MNLWLALEAGEIEGGVEDVFDWAGGFLNFAADGATNVATGGSYHKCVFSRGSVPCGNRFIENRQVIGINADGEGLGFSRLKLFCFGESN